MSGKPDAERCLQLRKLICEIYLQNHDIVIKSPYEMAEIYSLLDGANDVQVTRCSEKLCNYDRNWDPRSLKFFLNGDHHSL